MSKTPITLRSETWYLRRRVPKRYYPVEKRRTILLSLHTDSRAQAETKWRLVWDKLLEGWEARLSGNSGDATRSHLAAAQVAAVRGFRYLPVGDVTELPMDKLLERIESASDMAEAAALLGTAGLPKLTVSEALNEYWTLSRDKTLGMTENQLRVWKNPRKKAVNNFIQVCGDKALDEVTRDDMLDFRSWWLDRIETEGLTPNSGNKDFTHLSQLLKSVNTLKRLGLDLGPILSELAFKEGEKRSRPPFSTSWITSKILAPNALSGLNSQARCIVLAMVNTGARPSELATLDSSTIDLAGSVPSLTVSSDRRRLKTGSSKRTIPLLGVSLEALKECPNGFPRYFDNPGLSGTINSYFSENGLKETDQHTLYSFRHSFEDRMLAAGIDERVRRDLMGHSLGGRQRYGKGAELKLAADLLDPVAL
ncbi:tyrosine-type recombinase/integrase [Ruegeria sp. EL01]|uniref:tyrosine-type recombinase/integrase n=1 Tax=Ruegeria sp. EL01 TaxID=2107578 RepID=UPI000EA80939|nr:tyrosine-type recombinase/integrase [Ruegeria sp. EL01]